MKHNLMRDVWRPLQIRDVGMRGLATGYRMAAVRADRAKRLRALRLRPWWRKVWDGVVYVVTGREP